MNLYEFAGNDAVLNADWLGLEWTIERRREPRARVWASSTGDTIESLARKLRLNASEYRKWLRRADGGSLPERPLNPDTCWEFSVPNTAYVDASSYSWGFLGWYLIFYSRNLQASWEAEGLHVVYTSTWSTTKQELIACESNDGASTWRENVAKPGWLRTVNGVMGAMTPWWYVDEHGK